jgi:hypothetical protein
MSSISLLDEWLDEKDIPHFTARELCPVGKKANGDGPELLLAPAKLWMNALPTLRVLEWLRAELDAPISVLSGYRDPVYNRAVGGAKSSYHVKFNAFDIRVKGHEPLEVARQLLEHPGGAHRLGIGYYPNGRFVHVDTRGVLAPQAPVARWDYETHTRWWTK